MFNPASLHIIHTRETGWGRGEVTSKSPHSGRAGLSCITQQFLSTYSCVYSRSSHETYSVSIHATAMSTYYVSISQNIMSIYCVHITVHEQLLCARHYQALGMLCALAGIAPSNIRMKAELRLEVDASPIEDAFCLVDYSRPTV